jgi:hypothetical protein
MSDLLQPRADDEPATWITAHLMSVVGVMLRVVREPALAFDLATELLAVAAMRWQRAPAEASRMAWVLGFAPALIHRAVEADRVPCDERMRNRPHLQSRALTREAIEGIRGLLEVRLELDPEARRVAARLEAAAPPPGRLRRLLSPLVHVEDVGDRA